MMPDGACPLCLLHFVESKRRNIAGARVRVVRLRDRDRIQIFSIRIDIMSEISGVILRIDILRVDDPGIAV